MVNMLRISTIGTYMHQYLHMKNKGEERRFVLKQGDVIGLDGMNR